MSKEADHIPRIIITGGGTGGHLFPALAVAEEFLKQYPLGEVLFIGTGRAIDSKALKEKGFENRIIRCGGLKGGTLVSRLKTLLSLPIGLLQAINIIRQFKPDLVFGVGGYVTGPVLLAAKLMGVSCCIHEQNSVPGLANRKLGLFVDRVFLSIPGSEAYFPAEKCVLSGNPVRKDFLERRAESQQKCSTNSHNVTLMVVGGSQGAHRLNQLVPEALGQVQGDLPGTLRVIHQTGTADLALVEDVYRKEGIDAITGAFFSNMSELLGQADLIICRAGATTLAELTVLGKPSILVPFPYAADDHQTKNAQYLVDGNAAIMFHQSELKAKLLGQEVVKLVNDLSARNSMAKNSAKLARPNAAAMIVEECVSLI